MFDRVRLLLATRNGAAGAAGAAGAPGWVSGVGWLVGFLAES